MKIELSAGLCLIYFERVFIIRGINIWRVNNRDKGDASTLTSGIFYLWINGRVRPFDLCVLY